MGTRRARTVARPTYTEQHAALRMDQDGMCPFNARASRQRPRSPTLFTYYKPGGAKAM